MRSKEHSAHVQAYWDATYYWTEIACQMTPGEVIDIAIWFQRSGSDSWRGDTFVKMAHMVLDDMGADG